ncbi:MAG: 3-octaprenyl-4hydroxybenzoate decarboxylase, partial [Firmicutes bacterium]|nr:3-octaprenyl-4hydroxybenzoate decarboxylase [Bacillota bacterium]
MAFKDLHEFISLLETRGELVRIKTPVDPELEITEITDRVSKAFGPALLFENVKGSDLPVLINAYGTTQRMAMSLQVKHLDDIGEEISKLLQIAENVPNTLLGKVKLLPQLAELSSFFPRMVKSGSCQEVVSMEPDLDKLPVLKCWPQDAGRFITLPQVYTRNPRTGKRNLGMYRLQVYDKNTTGMHWHMHH